MSEAVQTAQPEFPAIFIDYSKEKLRTQRELVEYLAQFGPPLLRAGAQMILAAAGENAKNPAKATEQQQETGDRK
ncbi:MAG: hypothetical protein Q8M92_04380 [Candidatus Subteraquimicrobiales bacterium]|nr:hypothetical protein [Candidatus Subteraquimicrobiales bacterium]